MATNSDAEKVLGVAGVKATEETLSIAKKVLDASEKIGESAKQTAGYVVDLANAYKNALKHTSALSKINAILVSDTRMRYRLESELEDQIAERLFTMNRDRLTVAKEIIDKQKVYDAAKKAQADELKEAKEVRKQNSLGFKDWFSWKKQKEKWIASRAEIKNIKDRHKSEIDAAEEQLKAGKKKTTTAADELKISQAALANLRIKSQLLNAVKDNATGVISPFVKTLGVSGNILSNFKGFKDPMSALNTATMLVSVSMQGISKIVEVTVARFKELEETAEKFRKETGFTINQSKELKDYIAKMSAEYAHVGLSAEEFTKSQKALSEIYNDINAVEKDTLLTTTMLAVNLNVAQEDTAKILTTFMGINGMTEKVAMNTVKNTANLFQNSKAGISFSAVMKDVANASDDVLTSIGASPAKLIRAATAARAMGLELNKVGAQQKRLLDYSSSITDELEASALLGRNITFMKARQLAFEGKSAESTQATLDVVKQMGDFNAMTPYQRAAVAKAAGMELKDLTKALAVDKVRNQIMNGTNTEARKRLERQDSLLKALEKENDLTEEQLLNQQEQAINQQNILGLTTQLNNAFKSIALIFSQTFGPSIEFLAKELTSIASKLSGASDGTKALIATVGSLLMITLAVGSAFISWLSIRKVIRGIKSEISTFGDAAEEGMKAATKSVTDGTKDLSEKTKKMSRRQRRELERQQRDFASRATVPTAPIQDAAKSKAGEGFGAFMKNVAGGFKEFTNLRVIGGIAVVLASFYGFGVVMKTWNDIDWEKAMSGVIVLGSFLAIAKLAGPAIALIAKGAGAIALVGLALLPFSAAMDVLSGASIKFANGLNMAKDSLVDILEKARPENIAAFGIGLATFSLSLAAVAPVANIAGAALLVISTGLMAFALSMRIMGNSAEKFGKGMVDGVNALQSLAAINFITLFQNMNKLGDQLKTSTGTFSNFVSGVFGKDALAKIGELSKMSKDITPTADAIAKMTSSFQNFQAVDNFGLAIGRLAESFKTLGQTVSALNIDDIKNKVGGVMQAITPATTAATTTTTSPTDTSKLEQILSDKLDSVVSAISGMTVVMDGREVGRVAVKYGASMAR